MKEIFKRLFCRHKNNEVVCWHWTHGWSTSELRFIEIQLKCNNCGKYHFMDIRDPEIYEEFREQIISELTTDDIPDSLTEDVAYNWISNNSEEAFDKAIDEMSDYILKDKIKEAIDSL